MVAGQLSRPWHLHDVAVSSWSALSRYAMWIKGRVKFFARASVEFKGSSTLMLYPHKDYRLAVWGWFRVSVVRMTEGCFQNWIIQWALSRGRLHLGSALATQDNVFLFTILIFPLTFQIMTSIYITNRKHAHTYARTEEDRPLFIETACIQNILHYNQTFQPKHLKCR